MKKKPYTFFGKVLVLDKLYTIKVVIVAIKVDFNHTDTKLEYKTAYYV